MYETEQTCEGRRDSRRGGFRILTKDVLRSSRRELFGRYAIGKTYSEMGLAYNAVRDRRLRPDQLGGYFAKELAQALNLAASTVQPENLADAIDRANLDVRKLRKKGIPI